MDILAKFANLKNADKTTLAITDAFVVWSAKKHGSSYAEKMLNDFDNQFDLFEKDVNLAKQKIQNK